MTIAEQQREQHQQPRPQPDQRAQANRDLAREHGNHIATLADLAEESFDEADSERCDRTRYEDALQVLRFLIGADWSERVLEQDRVLHDEHGSFMRAKAVEFIDLLLAGNSSVQARQIMLDRSPTRARRAQARRAALTGARHASANLHHMAEAPKVQPALPPAVVGLAPPNGVELPQRVPGVPVQRHPIAPALPPMVPPAPPESPAEQTGQIIAALRGNGHEISAEMEAAARKDHKSGLAVAPPDPAFAATAIPAQRNLADTVAFRADDVLAAMAADDASQEMVADGPVKGDASEPRPFEEAATAKRSAAASGKDAGDDDA